MIAILKKEINTFFSSLIGYLVIGVFLLLNGFFLWVFEGAFNIFDGGLSSLSSFFLLSPWILLFLVPAVTMKSFSEEKKQGTLELLLTKPLSVLQIVLGKYFGAMILVILALVPTVIYSYTVWNLGDPKGNLDFAITLGGYLGLFFLITAYTAVGIFASTLSDNQVVSFIIAVFICFFLYYGFEGLAQYTLFNNFFYIENLGFYTHFNSMSKGVLDTRDILYFLSIVVFFIVLANLNLQKGNT